MKKRSSNRSLFAYSTMGIQLAATVTIFVIGGYKLDQHYERTPVFITIGAFLGMGIGFYHLVKQLKGIEEAEKRERALNKNEVRKKWL